MTGKKMRKQIVEVLKRANKPLTFNEIVESIGIEKDTWVVMAELNHLQFAGVIKVERNGFGKTLYGVDKR